MASMSKGLVRRGDHGCCVDPACRHFGPRRSGDCYLLVAATSEWSHACGRDTGTEVKDRQVGKQAHTQAGNAVYSVARVAHSLILHHHHHHQ